MSVTEQATEFAVGRRTLSVEEAAEELGIGRRTLYQMIREGRCPVPVLVMGRRIRIPRRRLDEYIDGDAGASS